MLPSRNIGGYEDRETLFDRTGAIRRTIAAISREQGRDPKAGQQRQTQIPVD